MFFRRTARSLGYKSWQRGQTASAGIRFSYNLKKKKIQIGLLYFFLILIISGYDYMSWQGESLPKTNIVSDNKTGIR